MKKLNKWINFMKSEDMKSCYKVFKNEILKPKKIKQPEKWLIDEYKLFMEYAENAYNGYLVELADNSNSEKEKKLFRSKLEREKDKYYEYKNKLEKLTNEKYADLRNLKEQIEISKKFDEMRKKKKP